MKILKKNIIKIFFLFDFLLLYTILYFYSKERFIIFSIDEKIDLLLFLIIIFLFSYFSKIKYRYIYPVIFSFAFFIFFDLFYLNLSRTPRISDIENIFTLFDFMPKESTFIILFFVLLVVVFIFLILNVYKKYSKKIFVKTMLFRGLFILFIFYFFASNKNIQQYDKFFHLTPWSQEQTIKENGRFISFVFYNNLERENIKKLNEKKLKYLNIDINSVLYKYRIKQKRDIYIVVLESFINPNFLKNIKYSINPMSETLKPYLINNQSFSKVISPVYGGNTAQAEFEILTGIKAFAKINTIEFNVMKGFPISSFVNRLKQEGYMAFSTIATGSGYFNSKQAYKSIGFDKIDFLEEDKNFKRDKNDVRIFDGDLFDYNIKQIKTYIKNKKPFINYILGVYGHILFERNLYKRPDVIEVDGGNDYVHRIANQFYYRTKSLAKYISMIRKLDHNAIIYITSDHIPPILNKNIKYKFKNNVNISILIDGNKIVDVSGKKYYEIPWYIFDLLTKNSYTREFKNISFEDLYYKLLLESIGKQ